MRLDPLLAAYLTSTFILAVTPGATTAVVVRSTLARGWRGGLAAAAGAACGNTIQAVVAAFGTAMLFARWPAADTVLRVCGAAFLLWLGIRSLWAAWRNARLVPADDGAERKSVGHGFAFRQGLTVNLLNPAITTFYVAVVPSFVPPGAGLRRYALLAAAHIVIAFACHFCWAAAFDTLSRRLEGPAVRRAIEVTTAMVLIALAVQVYSAN